MNLLRLALIGLLALSILGPWGVTSDGVPPPEYCASPAFLLSPDHCARWLPGAEFFQWMTPGLFTIPWSLFTGGYSLAERLRELVIVFLANLLLLPFLTTLLLLLPGRRRWRRRLHIFAWAAAILLAMVLLGSQFTGQAPILRLWGLWLYLAVALAALALELLSLRLNPAVPGSQNFPAAQG